MGREKDAQKVESQAAYVEVQDISGNLVRLPLNKVQGNMREPHRDEDGMIPEFVNISGVRQQMVIPNDPSGTIRVEPWGVLRGAQWRSFSEPSRAWGNTPRFIERRKGLGSSYDSVYLLEQEQIIGEVTRIKNPDPAYHGYKLLEGWEANAKIHEIDPSGRLVGKDYTEDRGAVLTAIAKQRSFLQKAWVVEAKNRGMADALS